MPTTSAGARCRRSGQEHDRANRETDHSQNRSTSQRGRCRKKPRDGSLNPSTCGRAKTRHANLPLQVVGSSGTVAAATIVIVAAFAGARL